MTFIATFRQRISGTTAQPPKATKAYAHVLRSMLGVCHACGRALSEHHYQNLAEAGNESDMLALLTAEANRDWKRIATISSFEGDKNAIILTAIRCPTKVGAIAVFLDPVELWDNARLIQTSVLSSEDWSSIHAIFSKTDWKPF